MKSIDVHRIDHESQHPRMLDLHFVLQRLRSTVSFMNSGAHPDDETSAMLAALGFRDGLDLSYVCANRGEGGQNDIGTESGAALGTLRTAEMERAANVLDMRLYWLSANIHDAISDFRFSKSGKETLAKWGHAHTLKRFVTVVRREKPDILCPTFLDIPGQHGHHRAMTQLAHEVITAAADNTVKANFNGQALPPWSVSKLYLPAWGGGGTSYDDELPPPAATLTVSGKGIDELSGWSWERIGQQSRRYHLTQGMGRWVAPGNERNWPLHLAWSEFSNTEHGITDNLPANLSQLADFAQATQISSFLVEAQVAIDQAIDAFPEFDAVVKCASSALQSVRKAQQNCPPHAQRQVQHRLARKISQLSRVIRIASGVDVHAIAQNTNLRPGQTTSVAVEIRTPEKKSITCSYAWKLNENWQVSNDQLTLEREADPSDPYPIDYFPDSPKAPAIKVDIKTEGVASHSFIELHQTPVALPVHVINLQSSTAVVNRQTDNRTLFFPIEHCVPATADISVAVPDEWSTSSNTKGISIELPRNIEAGHYELGLSINGKPAVSEQVIAYPHAPLRLLVTETTITVLVLDVTLPDTRIAYIGGGNDRVFEQLCAMGLAPTALKDESFNASHDLDSFDTLVVGVFAMRTCPSIANNMQHVHRWIENGGHLVTLYHRPWDNWIPDKIPPEYLEIGQPSLRYRVTDENAAVTHLIPDHHLLNHPNKITAEDWQHWHKERGLYFAKSWSEAYQALLSMHDPDEGALTGSLLSAEIGQGRHSHTSLVLHHQMAKLVPGGFRLMANLLA